MKRCSGPPAVPLLLEQTAAEPSATLRGLRDRIGDPHLRLRRDPPARRNPDLPARGPCRHHAAGRRRFPRPRSDGRSTPRSDPLGSGRRGAGAPARVPRTLASPVARGGRRAAAAPAGPGPSAPADSRRSAGARGSRRASGSACRLPRLATRSMRGPARQASGSTSSTSTIASGSPAISAASPSPGFCREARSRPWTSPAASGTRSITGWRVVRPAPSSASTETFSRSTWRSAGSPRVPSTSARAPTKGFRFPTVPSGRSCAKTPSTISFARRNRPPSSGAFSSPTGSWR